MSWLKRIAEVLGLEGHLPVSKLHDAHRVGRPCIAGDDDLSDPEVSAAPSIRRTVKRFLLG